MLILPVAQTRMRLLTQGQVMLRMQIHIVFDPRRLQMKFYEFEFLCDGTADPSIAATV